jgi:hypothetical protein
VEKVALLEAGSWGLEAGRYPPPGCFAKRGWICLIAKDLTFLEMPKRLQVFENSRFEAGCWKELKNRTEIVG